MSQRAVAVSRAHPITIQRIVSGLNSYRTSCHTRCRACHSSPAPCRRAFLRRIAAPGVLCRDTKPPFCHDTNDCIVTHLNGQTAVVLAPLARRAGLVARMAGSIAALLRAPTRTRLAVSCPGAPVVSQYNMLYCNQDWDMGSSPRSCMQPFFCHSSFFFVPATIRPQNIYIYIHVFSRTKNIYFKFFFCFTHCKTPEKKIYQHFCFRLFLDYFAQKFSNT